MPARAKPPASSSGSPGRPAPSSPAGHRGRTGRRRRSMACACRQRVAVVQMGANPSHLPSVSAAPTAAGACAGPETARPRRAGCRPAAGYRSRRARCRGPCRRTRPTMPATMKIRCSLVADISCATMPTPKRPCRRRWPRGGRVTMRPSGKAGDAGDEDERGQRRSATGCRWPSLFRVSRQRAGPELGARWPRALLPH